MMHWSLYKVELIHYKMLTKRNVYVTVVLK